MLLLRLAWVFLGYARASENRTVDATFTLLAGIWKLQSSLPVTAMETILFSTSISVMWHKINCIIVVCVACLLLAERT